jgi:hypothetical protein
MDPEKESLNIFLAALGTMLSLFGINFRWTHAISKKVDSCVPKEDFTHRMDRMEDSIKDDIQLIRIEISKLAERRLKTRKTDGD